MTSEATEKVRERGRETMSHFREQAGAVREDVRELARAAGDTAMEKIDPILDYVRDKPLNALLIAVGVGAAIGFIFRR